MAKRYLLPIFILILFLGNCANPETDHRQRNIKKKRALAALGRVDALPKTVKSPTNNPSSKEKIELGRLLFFDPILSGDKEVACATCHHPTNGWAEYRDISIGVNGVGFASKRVFKTPNTIPFVKKNAHTILNTAFNGIDIYNAYTPENAPMFWDLRTKNLELQAIEPLKTMEEMRGLHYSETDILVELVTRLKAIPAYQTLFEQAFPTNDIISIENIGKAIAAFERTLLTNNSRFDQYMRGDETAISLSEKDGFELFKKVGCANCHNGPMFSDYQIHVLGVPENPKLGELDKGFEETFGFRTPSLRNLRFTAPYMHNGMMLNLQRVLEFYEDISFGKSQNPAVSPPQFDPLVKELKLRVRDMAPIISFLNTLNGEEFDKTIPESVPSGLSVGGNITTEKF